MEAKSRRVIGALAIGVVALVPACGREGSIVPGSSPSPSPRPTPTSYATPEPSQSPTPSPSASPSASPTPQDTPSGTRAPGPGNAGIQGSVRAGPDCPLEQQGSPCPEQRVPGAEVSATPADGGDAFTTTADAEGSFSLRLPPGSYDVTASSPTVEDCQTQRVDVVAGQYRPVVISCTTPA